VPWSVKEKGFFCPVAVADKTAVNGWPLAVDGSRKK
jgi:hypothetical protein